MADYSISLGVTVDKTELNNVKSQINALTDNTHRVRIDIDNSRLLKQINQVKSELKGLNKLTNDSKGLSLFNSADLVESVKGISGAIKEIRASLSSLNNNVGLGSLTGSINQIATAIGKVENESDSLVNSLNALSKKDFSINFDLKMGGQKLSNVGYGRAARKQVIPQLESQIEYLEGLFGGRQGAVNKLVKANSGFDVFTDFENFNSKSAIRQMEAYENYINNLRKLANANNIDLSGFDAKFTKSASEMINSITGIGNAADTAEKQMDKIKNLFDGGGGQIDMSGLSTQVDSIVTDLGEIRTAVQSLSSGVSIDGLTQGFNNLSSSIEQLVKNCINVKTALDSISNSGSTVGQTGSSFGNIANDLQQVTTESKNAENAFHYLQTALTNRGVNKSSIDDVVSGLKTAYKEVEAVTTKFGKDQTTLKVSVKGINELGEAVTIIKKFDVKDDGTLFNGEDIAQSFDTSADAAKRWKKEVSNAYQDAKKLKTDIGKLEVDLIGAKAKNDTKEIDRITNRISALKTELKGINDVYGGSFTTRQNNLLKQLDDKIADNKVKAENDVANKSELTETEAAFKRLKSLGKEISGLEIEIAGLDADKNVADIDKLTTRLRTLETEYDNLFNANEQKFTTGQIDSLTQDIADGSQKLESFKDKLASLRAEAAKSIKLDIEVGKFDNQIDDLESRLNRLSTEGTEEVRRSLEKVKSAYQEMQFAAGRGSKDVADEKWLAQSQEEYAAAVQRTTNLLKQQERAERELDRAQKLTSDRESLSLDMQNWLKENTKAAKKYGDAIRELDANLRKLENSGNLTEGDNKAARRQFNNWTKKAKSEGLTGLTWFDSLKEKFKQYSSYFSVAELFMYAEQGITDMFEQVKLIDSAMTELKKVTNETDASYDKFLSNAANRAKEIGTTIDGLVSSTADFARLGYDFNESAGLAEVANIYTVVGDEIDSVDTATESLVSTLAAFKGEMGDMSDSDFAMSIVDKFNEVDILAS